MHGAELTHFLAAMGDALPSRCQHVSRRALAAPCPVCAAQETVAGARSFARTRVHASAALRLTCSRKIAAAASGDEGQFHRTSLVVCELLTNQAVICAIRESGEWPTALDSLLSVLARVPPARSESAILEESLSALQGAATHLVLGISDSEPATALARLADAFSRVGASLDVLLGSRLFLIVEGALRVKSGPCPPPTERDCDSAVTLVLNALGQLLAAQSRNAEARRIARCLIRALLQGADKLPWFWLGTRIGFLHPLFRADSWLVSISASDTIEDLCESLACIHAALQFAAQQPSVAALRAWFSEHDLLVRFLEHLVHAAGGSEVVAAVTAVAALAARRSCDLRDAIASSSVPAASFATWTTEDADEELERSAIELATALVESPRFESAPQSYLRALALRLSAGPPCTIARKLDLLCRVGGLRSARRELQKDAALLDALISAISKTAAMETGAALDEMCFRAASLVCDAIEPTTATDVQQRSAQLLKWALASPVCGETGVLQQVLLLAKTLLLRLVGPSLGEVAELVRAQVKAGLVHFLLGSSSSSGTTADLRISTLELLAALVQATSDLCTLRNDFYLSAALVAATSSLLSAQASMPEKGAAARLIAKLLWRIHPNALHLSCHDEGELAAILSDAQPLFLGATLGYSALISRPAPDHAATLAWLCELLHADGVQICDEEQSAIEERAVQAAARATDAASMCIALELVSLAAVRGPRQVTANVLARLTSHLERLVESGGQAVDTLAESLLASDPLWHWILSLQEASALHHTLLRICLGTGNGGGGAGSRDDSQIRRMLERTVGSLKGAQALAQLAFRSHRDSATSTAALRALLIATGAGCNLHVLELLYTVGASEGASQIVARALQEPDSGGIEAQIRGASELLRQLAQCAPALKGGALHLMRHATVLASYIGRCQAADEAGSLAESLRNLLVAQLVSGAPPLAALREVGEAIVSTLTGMRARNGQGLHGVMAALFRCLWVLLKAAPPEERQALALSCGADASLLATAVETVRSVAAQQGHTCEEAACEEAVLDLALLAETKPSSTPSRSPSSSTDSPPLLERTPLRHRAYALAVTVLTAATSSARAAIAAVSVFGAVLLLAAAPSLDPWLERSIRVRAAVAVEATQRGAPAAIEYAQACVELLRVALAADPGWRPRALTQQSALRLFSHPGATLCHGEPCVAGRIAETVPRGAEGCACVLSV